MADKPNEQGSLRNSTQLSRMSKTETTENVICPGWGGYSAASTSTATYLRWVRFPPDIRLAKRVCRAEEVGRPSARLWAFRHPGSQLLDRRVRHFPARPGGEPCDAALGAGGRRTNACAGSDVALLREMRDQLRGRSSSAAC